MSASRRLLKAGVAALALAGAWWLGLEAARVGPVPDESAVATPVSLALRPADMASDTALALQGGRMEAPAPGPAAMPAPDARLVDAWPSLLALAEAGDEVAACRLAVSAARCAQLDTQAQVAEIHARALVDIEDDQEREAEITRMAHAFDQIDATRAMCAGMDDRLRDAMPGLLLRAARGSDEPHALYLFADGHAFGERMLFADEGRRLHREHAAWAVQRLVDLGEPDGLTLLWLGHDGPNTSLLSSVLPRDRARSIAALTLLNETVTPGVRDPRRQIDRLSGEERDRAEALLVELRQRFEAAGGPSRARNRGIQMLVYGATAWNEETRQPGDPARFCDDATARRRP